MREEHLETTQPTKTPIKVILAANAHWCALGVAVLIWALHLMGLIYGPPASQNAVAEGIPAREALFDERIDGIFVDKKGELSKLDELKMAVTRSFAALPGLERAPGEDLTYSSDIILLAREGARNEILFLPPSDLTLEVKMGSMVLTWMEDDENNVDVDHWEILRAIGDASLALLAKVPADQATYEDKDVKAGLAYTYRVLAVTADETVAPADRTSKKSPPKRAEAASDIRISLVSGDAARGEAVLRVEKWHKGAWWPRNFTVRRGGRIGGKDSGSGIDYSTGRTLKSLEAKNLEEALQVDMVVFDEAGRVLVRNGNPVTEEISLTERFLELTAVVAGGALPPRTLRKRQKN